MWIGGVIITKHKKEVSLYRILFALISSLYFDSIFEKALFKPSLIPSIRFSSDSEFGLVVPEVTFSAITLMPSVNLPSLDLQLSSRWGYFVSVDEPTNAKLSTGLMPIFVPITQTFFIPWKYTRYEPLVQHGFSSSISLARVYFPLNWIDWEFRLGIATEISFRGPASIR